MFSLLPVSSKPWQGQREKSKPPSQIAVRGSLTHQPFSCTTRTWTYKPAPSRSNSHTARCFTEKQSYNRLLHDETDVQAAVSPADSRLNSRNAGCFKVRQSYSRLLHCETVVQAASLSQPLSHPAKMRYGEINPLSRSLVKQINNSCLMESF